MRARRAPVDEQEVEILVEIEIQNRRSWCHDFREVKTAVCSPKVCEFQTGSVGPFCEQRRCVAGHCFGVWCGRRGRGRCRMPTAGREGQSKDRRPDENLNSVTRQARKVSEREPRTSSSYYASAAGWFALGRQPLAGLPRLPNKAVLGPPQRENLILQARARRQQSGARGAPRRAFGNCVSYFTLGDF